MKTWFVWPLLVGAVVLAIDVPSTIDHVEPAHETPLDHPPSPRPSPSAPLEEIKVSFVRGRLLQPQKTREMEPQVETKIETVRADENLLNHSTAVVSNVELHTNVNKTTTTKPKVKVLPAKIRRKRPQGHRRVFADRVFGKRYGQGRPKVVVNKLKHDLLNSSTREVANRSENGGEDERSGRKRKMESKVWKGAAVGEGELANGGKLKRDLNVWKNLVDNWKEKYIRKIEAAPEVALAETAEVGARVNHAESGVNSTKNDLEPPRKALLTYRQFVEKKLSKLSRALGFESFITEAIGVQEGSGRVGDLPDDHESTPLEGNVLSVMAVP